MSNFEVIIMVPQRVRVVADDQHHAKAKAISAVYEAAAEPGREPMPSEFGPVVLYMREIP